MSVAPEAPEGPVRSVLLVECDPHASISHSAIEIVPYRNNTVHYPVYAEESTIITDIDDMEDVELPKIVPFAVMIEQIWRVEHPQVSILPKPVI